MARQTRQPDEWIVADGGRISANCTMGQIHLRNTNCNPGVFNFLGNLRQGVWAAKGEAIIFMEDDDWYRPDYLELTVRKLAAADLVGGIWQPYYHVPSRRWKLFRNRGASLCQTGMRRHLIPCFLGTLDACTTRQSFGVDGYFWKLVTNRPEWNRDEYDDLPVVGIKGIPGTFGLGVGHRPKPDWKNDPDWSQLKRWVGDDWKLYSELVV